jgi:hypothetical protein
MDLDAACRVFRQLGATPDVIRVEALVREAAPRAAGGLTAREVEVLGISSRAAAASYAVEHHLA